MVSSPADVELERRQVLEAVDELNRTVGPSLSLLIQAFDWSRDVYPGAGRPQGVVNDQLGAYDIFVGLMWRRFGSLTGHAGSGTEEEFLLAYDSWKQSGSPKILFYFCEAPIPYPTSPAEVDQLAHVLRFRDRLAREYPQLTGSYTDRHAFKDVVRPHLHNLLTREFGRPSLRLAPWLLALLEQERDACASRTRTYHTPNTLLALLQLPDGVTRRSLDALRPGLADDLEEKLSTYVRRDVGPGIFVPFKWEERSEFRRAQRLAHEAGAGEIGDKHLLLGVLEGDSATTRNLSSWLGATQYARLLEIARREEPGRAPSGATSGFLSRW
jgi:hypothetical protein